MSTQNGTHVYDGPVRGTTEAPLRMPRFRMPYDKESERDLLGCIIFKPELIDEHELSEDHFYDVGHKVIFKRMREIDSSQGSIDASSLLAELRRHNEIEIMGGAAELARILNDMPVSAQHGNYHATNVKSYWMQRQLMVATIDILEIATNKELAVMDRIERAESRMFAVGSEGGITRRTMVRLADITEESVADIISRRTRGATIDIPTGMAADHSTAGLRRKELYVMAARPGVGKTSYALQACTHAAREGVQVLFVSLEMSRVELIDRLISNLASVSLTQIRNGTFRADHETDIHNAAHVIRGIPITIEDSSTLDLAGLSSVCRRWARQVPQGHRPGIICVDYLQLITPEKTGGRRDKSRQEEVAESSRRLKSLARELDVAILCLAQVNRNSGEANRAPKLHELRESGAIEQDADVVAFLYRPEKKTSGHQSAERVQYIIEKNRNGPRSTHELNFTGRFCRFEDAATEEQEASTGTYQGPSTWGQDRAANDFGNDSLGSDDDFDSHDPYRQ